MVAQKSPGLTHVEYVHIICQHLGKSSKTLMKGLTDVSTDVGALLGRNLSNCPCCIKGKNEECAESPKVIIRSQPYCEFQYVRTNET